MAYQHQRGGYYCFGGGCTSVCNVGHGYGGSRNRSECISCSGSCWSYCAQSCDNNCNQKCVGCTGCDNQCTSCTDTCTGTCDRTCTSCVGTCESCTGSCFGSTTSALLSHKKAISEDDFESSDN